MVRLRILRSQREEGAKRWTSQPHRRRSSVSSRLSANGPSRPSHQTGRRGRQEEDELPVHPILVVQVQDASGKQISKTNIAEAMRVIQEEAGPLDNGAFAHALQEGARLEVGGRELRYLAPSDIEGDPDVRVVFSRPRSTRVGIARGAR
jgi:hypothetical protein